jgi:hypothetical protein
MQYFLGLEEYTYKDVFDRSLFTTLRYRLGADKFDAMTRQIILTSEGKHEAARKDLDDERNDVNTNKVDKDGKGSGTLANQVSDKASSGKNEAKEKPKGNKGVLIVDGTVADQMIAYPTDLGLLARSREESERIIDELCNVLNINVKPRTYRRLARKQYLNVAKKKNKTKNELRKAIGQQLRYLRRNLKSIEGLLDKTPGMSFPLETRDQRIFWVIQHLYNQQAKMYKDKIHSVDNRIVNIYQPYVRPIVRGKDKAQVESRGAGLGVSIQNGFARINTLSWEAYNEGSDLKGQVEAYRKLNGFYPKVVISDKIYGSRENRQWLKDLDIRYSGKALGRPSAKSQTPYRKRKFKQEQGIRNQVEGKFGQGKNGYNLSRVRARAARTSESLPGWQTGWIAAIFFVMNLVRFSKEFLFSFFQMVLGSLFSIPNIFVHRRNENIAFKI